MFFTQGAWSYMAGMTDMILKLSEEDQRDLRMVGLKIRDYTMSTCYFLGERKSLALELVPLSASSPAISDGQGTLPQSRATVTTADGTIVRPYVLAPHIDEARSETVGGAGVKRSFQQMQADATDAAAGSTDGTGAGMATWGQGEDSMPSQLILSYSPYHRAKSKLNSKRRADMAAQAGRTRQLSPSVCYSVVFPPLPGRFDAAVADKLGVPKGKERGMLVRGQTITLPDGTKIAPEQCVSSSNPGGTVLIIDCPTPAHVTTLLQEQVYWDLVADQAKVGPLCVVHMSPKEVLSCADYLAWSKPFPASTAVVPPSADKPTAGSINDAKKAKGADKSSGQVPPVAHMVCSLDLSEVDRPLFVASERYLRLLHGLDAQIFPLSHGAYKVLLDEEPGHYYTNASGVVKAGKPQQTEVKGKGKESGSGDKRPQEEQAQSVVIQAMPRCGTSAPSSLGAFAGWPLMTFVLPPHKQPGLKYDVPETARMHYYCVSGCICTEAARSAIYSQLPCVGNDGSQPYACHAAQQGDQAKAADAKELAVEEVVFLGTGAAAPFKYRTVSAIYLGLSAKHAEQGGRGEPSQEVQARAGVLLDAGDGTYGAMVRKMGAEAADKAVMGLKMLFVSHKHADHISGAANILIRRGALLRQQRGAPAPARAPSCESTLQGACDSANQDRPSRTREATEVFECSVCGQRFRSESSVEMHQRATHSRIMRPPRRGVSDGEHAAGDAGGREDDGLLVVGPLWVDSWLRDLGGLEPLSYRFVDCQDVLASSKSDARVRLQKQMGISLTSVLVQHSFPAYGLVLDFGGSLHPPASKESFRLVYSGDTRPCNDLVTAGAGADLLIHEATHSDDMIDKARSDRSSLSRSTCLQHAAEEAACAPGKQRCWRSRQNARCAGAKQRLRCIGVCWPPGPMPCLASPRKQKLLFSLE